MNEKTCNSQEYKEKQRAKKIGDKNPRWKGGVSRAPYAAVYQAIRKTLEQSCMLCQSKEKLVAHHIDNNYKNNEISNIVIVCRGCHNKIHKTGLKLSDKTKDKISLARIGFKHSDETRKKMSKSKQGNKNCVGNHLSEETKRKISESLKRAYKKLHGE